MLTIDDLNGDFDKACAIIEAVTGRKFDVTQRALLTLMRSGYYGDTKEQLQKMVDYLNKRRLA